MKIAVIIATYRREDGTTPNCLKKAIESVVNQKHQDWKIFLIGDRYENERELDKIISLVPKEKIEFRNLSIAFERDRNYPKEMLWKYGGCNARNFGNFIAQTDGFEWMAQLDHDDFWHEDHLEKINQVIEDKELDASFVMTVSKYLNNNNFIPVAVTFKEVIPFNPIPEGIVHSSVCYNQKRIPLFYKDRYAMLKDENSLEKLKQERPADAYRWMETCDYMQEHNLKSYLVNSVTISHLEEGYELNK